MHDGSNHNSSTLTSILDIYGLSQLISEPTRITPTSSTLIGLCITSSPEKISKAGVVHLGISDHSLVFMTLKISYERTGSHRTIETRAFKNFNHHHSPDDFAQQPWNKCFSETNPEAMWNVWKDLFMEVVDRHVPLQNKLVSNKHSPWITYELTRKIYKRNYMKFFFLLSQIFFFISSHNFINLQYCEHFSYLLLLFTLLLFIYIIV